MKLGATLVLVGTLLADAVQCHYIFQRLSVNGVKGGQYDHVRKNTNYNSPVTDLSSRDLRCNVGCSSGASTTTLPVAAGSTVGFTADVAVYHQGPVSFYMTKVPSAATADGSTPWFKIKDIGPSFSNGQSKWVMSSQYSAKVPSCIPAGEYLLRIQQLGIHNPGGAPQFYIACAQIKVTGGGERSPKPLVSIPGAFKKTDPGYKANIYNNFKNYTVPGPAVFTC